jgi:glucose/arabinose dehydrogenase
MRSIHSRLMLRALMTVICTVFAAMPTAAQRGAGMPPRPLDDDTYVFDTAEAGRIRVVVMAKGLDHPWSIAFLPDGNILVTERAGRLRIVLDGVLDPQPIAGLPEVYTAGGGGLLEVGLHPGFSENGLVYLTFTKGLGDGDHTAALARGRLDGMALVDVEEIFVAETGVGGPPAGAPMLFGPDGMIYMGVGGANDDIAQRTATHQGKILRLTEDGEAAPDNPFVSETEYLPEIFTLGHRNMLGLSVHPETGAIWENENGPQGGDEVNVLGSGANYGWPVVSFGREYSGPRVSERTFAEGMEGPRVFWVPSIAASGMTFYTGDAFPRWQRNLFVGGLTYGRIPGTGQLHRIVFNENWEEIRREAILTELRQRIRNVEQGPDGFLYLVTDEDDGALLRIEPE